MAFTTTFNPMDLTPGNNGSLIGGNLILNQSSGSGVTVATRSIDIQPTGKFYLEFTVSLVGTGNQSFTGPGIANATDALGSARTVLASCATGGQPTDIFGTLETNFPLYAASGCAQGDIICMAVDFTVNPVLFWYRKNGGNWNNSGTANPATRTGGYRATPFGPYKVYCNINDNGGTSQNITMNAGATAFSFGVPSGFTSGWPSSAVQSATGMFFGL
jgi:hypothetical protein